MATARPQRSRAQVERFQPTSAAASERTSVVIPNGSGTALGELEFFNDNLTKLHADEDLVKGLHQFLFRQAGTKANRKKNIRQFRGFETGAETKSELVERLVAGKKWTLTLLKELCGAIGLEKGGTKEEVCERIVDYLMNPVEVRGSNKRKAAAPAKSSRSGKKTKKGAKGGAKRVPNTYMLFTNEVRSRVVAENPGASIGEIGKLIGAMWKDMDESEKEPYKARYAQLKAEAAERAASEADGKAEESGEEEEEKKSAGDEDEDDEC